MKTPTKEQVRIVWKKSCKSRGTFTDTNKQKVRFVHYKRLNSVNGLSQLAQFVVVCFGDTINSFFKKFAAISIVDPITKITWIVTRERIGFEGNCILQLELLAHELQHADDFSGEIKKQIKYLKDDDYRCLIEAKGEASGADLMWSLGYQIMSGENIFSSNWEKLYKSKAKLAIERYEKLISEHVDGRFATKVGADVSKIVNEVCG